VPLDEDIREYKRVLATLQPPFVLPRRFISTESWTKAATEGGRRYLGLLREYEPELPAILVHKQIVILGEPGAGKSTVTHAVVQHILKNGHPADIPIVASLKSYDGNLRTLLLRNTPATILDAPTLTRTYILDGIDEVAGTHRAQLQHELNNLVTTDSAAKLVLTARQAFYAHHPSAFPDPLVAYHLLDFDDQDIRACARHYNVNEEAFLTAVHDIDCGDEIRNPFVLTVMLKRYHEHGSLNPLRSDNVGYVVGQLINSRPLVNAMRQQRALRMLAITCETAARNELTEEEALRVLHEAIELPAASAEQLLAELSQSILIRTPGRISFQMRSYGEFLAAAELHDKPLERLKELAFLNNTPLDNWLNAVTYLAEMNDKVRLYFARNYPEWLVNISPGALTEEERTTLTRQLLTAINQRQAYIVDEKDISLRRLARLLTPEVIGELRAQLASTQPHEVANALVLLGIRREQDIIPQALRLATEHRNTSSLRYAAIVALINVGDHTVVNDLVAFTQPGDAYHLQLIDAIGSLCAPADFPHVLPLLDNANAGLSAAFYHFRELDSKDALVAAIDYLIANPGTLHGFGLDSYLEPLIDLIPRYWADDIGTQLGLLLANLERAQFYDGKIVTRIVTYLAQLDHDATAVKAMIASLTTDGTRLRHIDHIIAGLITPDAARWIAAHAARQGEDLALWLPQGLPRDILAPQAPQVTAAQEQARARYTEEQQRREQAIISTRQKHQNTIRTSRNIDAIINACLRLQKEHWPEIAQEQRDWLTQEVNDTLERLDLANSIIRLTETQWTRPAGLNPLLNLTDYYNLQLANDVPIILALRSWADTPISNYYRRHGLSTTAQEALATQLRTATNDNIAQNVISFLRQTGYAPRDIKEILITIALDTTRTTQLRMDAIERIATTVTATDALITLLTDREESIRDHAFQALVKLQHRATISRALATLTDDELRAGEVTFPNSSPLDWIGNIKIPAVIDELRGLRQRALVLNLWRPSSIVTAAIANIDKTQAATIIRTQLAITPVLWQTHLRQEVTKLTQAARLETVQQTPFDQIITKLKGATSMIRIKVWCEGSTDRPIFRALFRELGEEEIAQTLDFVGGWPNLVSEQEPERWLDGCRQAAIIMDGDEGRKLTKQKQPLTDKAKGLERRFANYPLKLHVLRRYGIENYLPRHACETILGRDLTRFFPIPPDKKIDDHFCEPRSLWPGWLNRLRKKQPISFYPKHLNEQAALHIRMTDVEGTDLAEVVTTIKQEAVAARQY